ncbi:uncharacterized protein EV422DRAFT_212086 [Fimicolochytrium jonesii]|uniref:uncharacterized protein n=1 Tax=Fimicolochytrium jonesii TaxID=1396493 RepID=UPI0022FF0EBC|nr:uncharacterized protein EV422DRAFT_212086 [Fimicolochytrium jonesii]KAI8817686.1 hypothetical protein EV422DRAFT_212086 [Fimicolochytrium jonesii]
MASSDEDYYGLLGLAYGASEADIQRAYRKSALKYHPDKVGADNKQAARMWELLDIAVQTLSDPAKKSAYDAQYKSRIAQKRKLEAMDAGLRAAKESLERREQEASKRSKSDPTFMAAVHRRNEIDRLREEGMKKAQAAEEVRRQMFAAKVDGARREAEEVAVREARRKAEDGANALDRTVKVKWKSKRVEPGAGTAEALQAIFERYGPVEDVVLSSKGKSNAMVVFSSIFDANSAIEDQANPHFINFKLSWASGSEPPSLTSWKRSSYASSSHLNQYSSSTPSRRAAHESPIPPSASASFRTADFDDEYESLTLEKMRRAAMEKTAAAATTDSSGVS